MKRIIAPVLAAALVVCLCACGVKPMATGSDLSSAPTGDVSELSYKLGSPAISFERADGGRETVYITSITLRESCCMCTFLRQDSELAPDFPSLSAKTADGEAYELIPSDITEGTVCFEQTPQLPLSEIATISAGDGTINLKDLSPAPAQAENLYRDGLNRLSSMSWNELFAYCVGSAGAYSEGAYGELAARMIADPEEFALRLLAPAYDFGPSAKNALATVDITPEFYDCYGFDDALELEICIDICAACLSPDTAAVIDSLQTAGGAENNRVAKLLSEALTHIR